jgi:hypothetical protein
MRNYYSLINSMGSGTIPSTLNTGLYSVYKAESNANDSFSTNNGTAQGGLTYTTGKSGNAFTFNGTNAFTRLPNNAFNSLIGDFSISAWIYIPSGYVGGDTIYILQSMGCDSWFTNPYGWRFWTSGNQLYFQIFNHTNTYYNISYTYGFTTNSWYHVSVTRKGSTGSKLYINGSLVASDSNTVNPLFYANDITPTIGNLYMGTNGSKQNDYFAPNGSKVDEVNVWTKELTSTEITELQTKYYPY